MATTRSRWMALTLLAIVFSVASCASGPPPGPSPESVAGAKAKVILVAPFNIVSSLPPELEGSTRMVSDSLIAHLEAHGKTAHIISFRAGRELWNASMKEVRDSGGKRNFENAAKVYARKIGEQIDFDAMIVPSLFVQNAKVRNMTARWDGAEERMYFQGDAVTNRTQNVHSQTGTVMVRAASIFVHIIGRDGTAIQTKRSGLETIEHLHRTVKGGGGFSGRGQVHLDVQADNPPVEDEEMVRAGVAAVLSPFLPEEIPAPSPDTGDPETVIEDATNGNPS